MFFHQLQSCIWSNFRMYLQAMQPLRKLGIFLGAVNLVNISLLNAGWWAFVCNMYLCICRYVDFYLKYSGASAAENLLNISLLLLIFLHLVLTFDVLLWKSVTVKIIPIAYIQGQDEDVVSLVNLTPLQHSTWDF